jgi:hypothetical protein
MAKQKPQTPDKKSLKAQFDAGEITAKQLEVRLKQLKKEAATVAELNKIKAKERRLAAAAQEKEIAGNYLLTNQADVLTKKFGAQTKNATKLNDLRDELLKKLVAAKDNLILQKSIISDHTKQIALHADMRTKVGKKMMAEAAAIELARTAEEKRLAVTKELESKSNGLLDGLEAQVKGIPLIGGLLAEKMNIGGLKKQMGGIFSKITTGFAESAKTSSDFGTNLSAGMNNALPAIRGLAKGLGKATIQQIKLNIQALMNPYVAIAVAVIALIILMKKLFTAGMAFNQATTDISKNLGISVDAARDMEESFNNTSGKSANLAVNTKSLIKAQTELSAATGITAQFSEEMLESQINLTKFMGMTGEEAAKFQKTAMANGQTAREMQGDIAGSVKEFNDATGASISLKEVMGEVVNLSTELRIQFKGNNKELVNAIGLAKMMGTTLDESNASAEKTLDIESSLKAEAKARILTGISINNNEIRQAQLTGDRTKVLEAQKKQLEKISNFNDMAPTQQRALADAMGMTVGQVVKQKEAMDLAKKAGFDLSKATLDQLKNATGLTKVEKEKLIKQKEQMSANEKLAAMQTKMMDMLNGIVAGPLGEMVGILVDGLMPAFTVIQRVLSPIFKIIGYIVKLVFMLLKPFIHIGAVLMDLIMVPLDAIFNMIDGIIMLFTDFDAGIAMIGNSLVDMMLAPLEAIAVVVEGLWSMLTLGLADPLGLEDMVGELGGSMKVEVPVNAVLDGEPAAESSDESSDSINDGIVKPDGSVVKTNPADFIMAMKNPMEMFDDIGDMAGGLMSSVTSAFGGGGGDSVEIDYEKLAAAMSTRPIVLNIDGKAVSEISKVQNKQTSFRK